MFFLRGKMSFNHAVVRVKKKKEKNRPATLKLLYNNMLNLMKLLLFYLLGKPRTGCLINVM